MQSRHKMPFGVEVLEAGRARFRLWAPSTPAVELCLNIEDKETRLAMQPQSEGWFTLETDFSPPGDYRYLINRDLRVPDPASRHQPDDVHGISRIVDPCAFDWQDGEWRGRPWDEAVIYELHVGSFTPQGNFHAIKRRLDYLRDLGVTAIELMPVADFPGARNWGMTACCLSRPTAATGLPRT